MPPSSCWTPLARRYAPIRGWAGQLPVPCDPAWWRGPRPGQCATLAHSLRAHGDGPAAHGHDQRHSSPSTPRSATQTGGGGTSLTSRPPSGCSTSPPTSPAGRSGQAQRDECSRKAALNGVAIHYGERLFTNQSRRSHRNPDRPHRAATSAHDASICAPLPSCLGQSPARFRRCRLGLTTLLGTPTVQGSRSACHHSCRRRPAHRRPSTERPSASSSQRRRHRDVIDTKLSLPAVAPQAPRQGAAFRASTIRAGSCGCRGPPGARTSAPDWRSSTSPGRCSARDRGCTPGTCSCRARRWWRPPRRHGR